MPWTWRIAWVACTMQLGKQWRVRLWPTHPNRYDNSSSNHVYCATTNTCSNQTISTAIILGKTQQVSRWNILLGNILWFCYVLLAFGKYNTVCLLLENSIIHSICLEYKDFLCGSQPHQSRHMYPSTPKSQQSVIHLVVQSAYEFVHTDWDTTYIYRGHGFLLLLYHRCCCASPTSKWNICKTAFRKCCAP